MEGTVFVVDDNADVRDSIAGLVRSRGYRCQGFSTAQDFLDRCPPSEAGCLVVDVRLPGLSGLDLQQRLPSLGYSLPVIVMTAHGDVPMAVRALQAGALDFLEKPFDPALLLRLVGRALAADQRVRRMRLERSTLDARVALLTDRERDILRLVTEGHYNKVVADKLGVSISTVEMHRKKLMEKLRAESLYDLVRIAEICLAAPDDARAEPPSR